MVTTTIPTIGLKLNFLVRVLRANFVYVIFFLEDIQDIVRVSSSGPAGELYPDSLGDYRLTDITHNDLPVYQHSARDDRYIISVGQFLS